MSKDNYQCLKTTARDVYCSRDRCKRGTQADQWVQGCMSHFGITQANLLSSYPSPNQPSGATIWP